jgi:hypothetical protein
VKLKSRWRSGRVGVASVEENVEGLLLADDVASKGSETVCNGKYTPADSAVATALPDCERRV